MVQLKFELAYYGVAVQHFIHYATETLDTLIKGW